MPGNYRLRFLGRRKQGWVPQYLSITQVATDGQCVVHIAGELDISTAPRLADYLAGLGGQRVVVDLVGVTFIDSSGFGVLVGAHQRHEEDGGKLEIRGDSPFTMRSLRTLGLDTVFHLDNANQDDTR